ncbi:MAG: histidinol-phosphatase [Maritimibacter sp.]|nr:histidinol-phosphatase [Maritimibacter sp.]MCB1351848.1 histidinol-phosphatase [Paracoccaceae bacterium]
MAIAPELEGALRDIACELADVAAARCLPLFRSEGLLAANKAADGFDPVTAADRDAEAAMRTLLAERRPEDAIHGEEFGARPGTSGLTWVLDPIDGTRAFICGAPTWGILIGLDAGEGPVLGVIDQPHTGERFIGGFGAAEMRRGTERRAMRVRPCAGLSEAVLFTTYPEVGSTAEREAFETVRDRARLTRYSLDCYAYALVAMGQADLVIEAGLQAYDVQAPIAVIEAAGGIVTDWTGGPAHQGGRILAAGDARTHAEALALLSRAAA